MVIQCHILGPDCFVWTLLQGKLWNKFENYNIQKVLKLMLYNNVVIYQLTWNFLLIMQFSYWPLFIGLFAQGMVESNTLYISHFVVRHGLSLDNGERQKIRCQWSANICCGATLYVFRQYYTPNHGFTIRSSKDQHRQNSINITYVHVV